MAASRRTLGGARGLMVVAGAMFAIANADPVAVAPTQPIFLTYRVAAPEQFPAGAAGQGLVGSLNVQALTAATIVIPLPDGRVITALQRHWTRDDRLNTVAWTGVVAGSPHDIVALARREGALAGFFSVQGKTFELRPTDAGQYLLFEVQRQPVAEGDALGTPGLEQRLARKQADSTVGSLSATMQSVVEDLLVCYTASSLADFGRAALESMVIAATDAANESYRQSKINVTLSLVGLRQVRLEECATMPETVSAASCDEELAELRDQSGADLIVLLAENNDWCGYANIMDCSSVAFESQAFAVARPGCLSQRILAHEVGHLQGCAHDRATGGNPGAFPYARGYRRCVADGTSFNDIMAYPCPDVASTSLATFSSPDIFFEGYPTGVSYELDPANSADAARALNETAPTVARFRDSTQVRPARPSSLAASTVSASRIDLAWSDESADEAGFMVERTTDGTNYSEIARLSANIDTYADLTAGPNTTYSYRVVAYNSAGFSEYSNVATISPPTPGGGGEHSGGGNGGGALDVLWPLWALLLGRVRRHTEHPDIAAPLDRCT